jgi:hypothetical protein
VDISGATNGSYTLTAADAGYAVRVTVSRADCEGSLSSTPTGPVLPLLTGTVTISGAAVVGQTLTADTSGLNGSGTISYQWKRGGENISGATNGSYTLTSADGGYLITLTVSRQGYGGTISSNQAGPVLLLLTGTVTISGNPAVGQSLTADISGLNGSGTPSYQWKLGGVNIEGATGASYTPVLTDAGHAVSVAVSRAGYSGSVESLALTVKNQAGVTLIYPDVPGDPAEEALSSFTIYKTSSPSTWALTVQGDFDSYSYQWSVDNIPKNQYAGNGGKTLTLDAANYPVGTHYVSLEVMLGGMPYSKTITFTVGN